MVLALAAFSPDLNSVWDQILANAIVPSLDKVFARLLRVSSPSIVRGSSSSSKQNHLLLSLRHYKEIVGVEEIDHSVIIVISGSRP